MDKVKTLAPELKKLLAYELLQLHPQGSVAAASRMIGEARIDPNPHQIEAAIYGYQALQRGGAILADEVGLGKTIEAGLIINQYWAESKNHILIVAPVALRVQWQKELESLFYLPAQVISTNEWKHLTKGRHNPITHGEAGIFIVSDHLIVSQSKVFAANHWDLVVIDEAHRLRNVYRKKKNEAIQAKTVRDTFVAAPKLLLTATPFQNSLDELYGLVSIIDQSYFGSYESFQRLYSKPSKLEGVDPASLKKRIEPIFRRTLRREVSHYLHYTERKSVTVRHHYDSSSEEEALNQDIAEMMRAEYLFLNSKTARGFFDLIYLKLLGSSPYALNPALLKLLARFMQGMVKRGATKEAVDTWARKIREVFGDYPNWQPHYQELCRLTCRGGEISYETISAHLKAMAGDETDVNAEEVESGELEELEEEWQNDAEAANVLVNNDLTALDSPETLAKQIDVVVRNYFRTHTPHRTGRAKVFIETIEKHITEAKTKGFSEKAVVFTEYVRTLRYVTDLLKSKGFDDFEVIPYHGGLSSVKGADGLSERDRAIEKFRNSDKAILIATEAGAEGLNLQFCNLLINYDLPWNPQRIEQRIGRCHRYGQKNDVIVVNFVCEDNHAEKHIFKILSDKFKLFDGVFGASNSVLGALRSGVDVEKMFSELYLGVRSTQEVERQLEEFLNTSEATRKEGMRDVAKRLLEEFDPEVTKILKLDWDELKKEVNLNLTHQEQKLADIVRASVPGEYQEARSLFRAKDHTYSLLSSRQHTFQRLYADDDVPLITPRHAEVFVLLNKYKDEHQDYENSYRIPLSNELKKSLGDIRGPGNWLFAVFWRVEGASVFEEIRHYLVKSNGDIVSGPMIRRLFDELGDVRDRTLHASEADGLVQAHISSAESELLDERENISQQIYIDMIAAKHRAKDEQETAADALRAERRQVASEFDLALLKAPMKEKGKIIKDKESRLKMIDQELKVYEQTVAAIEAQEKALHKELTERHSKGGLSRHVIAKVHLEFT